MHEHERERQNEQRAKAQPPGGTAGRREREPAMQPRIYVASLSDYNDGRLHGEWMDAAQDVEQMQAQIDRMLAGSPTPGAEEWAIHDYEGFGQVRVGEYEPLERISLLVTGIEIHGEAFAAWWAATEPATADPDALASRFEESYRGQWDSMAAYAEECLDDFGAKAEMERIPDWLQPYVSLDVEGFGRDLELGGDVRTIDASNGGVFVFDAE
jgi:antirestriction protein